MKGADYAEPSPFGEVDPAQCRSETHRESGEAVPVSKIDRHPIQDAVDQQVPATGLCGDLRQGDTNFSVFKAKLIGQPKTAGGADADSAKVGLN
jgi:hypothetical protein